MYRERVDVPVSGTATAPIVFTVAPRALVVVSGQKYGFSIRGRSWVKINGFTVRDTRDYGIQVSDASHVTLSNNHVSYAGRPLSGQGKYGIRLGNVTNSLVVGNTVEHNTNAGIALVDGSTQNEVRGNRSFGNAKGFERAAAGIRLFASHANVLDRNISHENEDSGIELVKSRDNRVSNNISYQNGDHGIDAAGGSSGTRILANTIHHNLTAGINVEGGSTGTTVANNVSVANGIDSPRTVGNIRVDAPSVAGTSMDYDTVALGGGKILLVWNSVGYRTLAAFQAATRQELHGIDAERIQLHEVDSYTKPTPTIPDDRDP